jgi:hypothetical protein
MVYLMGLRRNRWHVAKYEEKYGLSWRAGRVKALYYEDFPLRGPRPPGLYLFADIELMREDERIQALELYESLCHDPVRYRVLNHPTQSLRRYDLLKHLAETKQNDFRAFRIADGWPEDLRYPVFLRPENEHHGALTDLLHNPSEIRGALATLSCLKPTQDSLLLAEYIHCADAEGIYRKYSVLRLGPHYIPAHMLVSRGWSLKDSQNDLWNETLLAEEADYLKHNPHGEQVRQIFETARIEYGRIDYAMVEGRMQVFEINTHPTLFTPNPQIYRPRQRHKDEFAERYFQAIKSLDPASRIPLKDKINWVARGIFRKKIKPPLRRLKQRLLA